MFWVTSVYFNIRNTLPKSGTFLLGQPVYIGYMFLEKMSLHTTKCILVSLSYVILILVRFIELIAIFEVKKVNE